MNYRQNLLPRLNQGKPKKPDATRNRVPGSGTTTSFCPKGSSTTPAENLNVAVPEVKAVKDKVLRTKVPGCRAASSPGVSNETSANSNSVAEN